MALDDLVGTDADVRELQDLIEHTSETLQKKIDWIQVWAKKYPVLASYRSEVRIGEYEAALAGLLEQLQKDYGYSSLDACLVLKDILAHVWQPEKESSGEES